MKKFLAVCALATLSLSTVAMSAADTTAGTASEAIMKRQWPEAESLLRQGLAQNPNDASRLLNLAFVLQNTDRSAEAAKVYQQILQLQQNPVVAVADPYTLGQPARAKRLAKQGMASLETK